MRTYTKKINLEGDFGISHIIEILRLDSERFGFLKKIVREKNLLLR